MKLIRVATAIKRYFDPEDAPDVRTLVSAVERGAIAGKIIRTEQRVFCWIDAEAFERDTGNPLADELLRSLEAPKMGKLKAPARRAITVQ